MKHLLLDFMAYIAVIFICGWDLLRRGAICAAGLFLLAAAAICAFFAYCAELAADAIGRATDGLIAASEWLRVRL